MFKKLYTHAVTKEEGIEAWGWQWLATYKATDDQLEAFQQEVHDTNRIGVIDVETQRQFEPETGLMNPLSSIDQTKLRLFTMFNAKNPKQRVDLVMQEGMKLICLRRTVGIGYRGFRAEEVFYVIGYKMGGQHHFTYIAEADGRMFISPIDNIDVPDLFLYPKIV